MLREPRRLDHTICTAVTPEAVFTVRTWATRAAYDPRLVLKFLLPATQNNRSQAYIVVTAAIVIKVRFEKLQNYNSSRIAAVAAMTVMLTIRVAAPASVNSTATVKAKTTQRMNGPNPNFGQD